MQKAVSGNPIWIIAFLIGFVFHMEKAPHIWDYQLPHNDLLN